MDRHLLVPGLECREAEPNCGRLINTLLRRELPERVPFMELYQDDEIRAAILGRPMSKMEDLVELQLRLGYDTIPFRMSPPFRMARCGAEDTAQLSRGERSWVVESLGTIKSREEFESYTWPEVDQSIPSRLEYAQHVLPEGMGITLQTSGVLENSIRVMGYQAFSEALYDDPQLVRDVADRVGELLVRTYQQGMDCEKVIGAFYADDMGFKTSTIISPEHLRTYILPWQRKIADICHKRGKIMILHSCGNVDAVMEDLISFVGIDAKHSFEDAIEPVSSVKRRYGNRIGIAGGVDMDFLARRSAEEVATYTRTVLEECAPGGGYALGSGNSVANYVPVENYFAMLREGWNFC